MGICDRLRGGLALAPGVLREARRDFAPATGDAACRLDEVVDAFAHGYNAVLRGGYDPAELPAGLRGFGYEGAAMSSTLLDLMTVSRGRRLHELGEGTGAGYPHLINVGAGWAYARMRLRPWWTVRPGTDEQGVGSPLLRWLAWDGWGFHRAFFTPRRVFADHAPGPPRVRRICDQGAGRALWFYAGADPDRIGDVINGFPGVRRPDLWAGVALAAAYTGAQPPGVLAALAERAAAHRAHLAQGAVFAAKAHVLSGEMPGGSAAAVRALTGVGPGIAARWADDALAASIGGPDSPAGYEGWRGGIRHAWTRTNERQTVG
ncbi:DUF1702 family protein [Actinomadura barringtoniae]|uniref:DUF1702 family protein n=1 Tax=Actinomadura barringtoniae TaxID=1427535 RepID=A0A939PVI0_9ACTN|nr:DUF1702 family protein [Actinomadura barringtoniae]MBO2455779.1 DUF1702 family protein [Actinomadura barringtoniae]